MQKILVQNINDYNPDQDQIIQYALFIGLKLPEDDDLLWIARKGLMQPLPKNWVACEDKDGSIFYFNIETKQKLYEHPQDQNIRKLYIRQKQKKIKMHQIQQVSQQEFTQNQHKEQSQQKKINCEQIENLKVIQKKLLPEEKPLSIEKQKILNNFKQNLRLQFQKIQKPKKKKKQQQQLKQTLYILKQKRRQKQKQLKELQEIYQNNWQQILQQAQQKKQQIRDWVQQKRKSMMEYVTKQRQSFYKQQPQIRKKVIKKTENIYPLPKKYPRFIKPKLQKIKIPQINKIKLEYERILQQNIRKLTKKQMQLQYLKNRQII